MGVVDRLPGRSLYLDANVFIYALEGYPAYAAILGELFEAIDDGEVEAFTSELTLAEVLVKPMMDRNVALQRAYQNALQPSASLHVLPISRQVLVEAAGLRGQQSALKLPDAIHLATAQLTQCQAVLTNDLRLRDYAAIQVVLLSDAAT